MSAKRAFLLMAIGIAFVAPLPAVAGSLTVSFTGTIDTLFFTTAGPGGSPADSGYDGSFSVGSPFSGSLTLNDAASDLDPSSDSGLYRFDAPPWSAAFQVGNYTFSARGTGSCCSGFEVYVNDRLSGVDQVLFAVPNPSVIRVPTNFPYMQDSGFYIFLRDSVTATALESDDLASVPFTLAAWPSASIEFRAVAAPTYPSDFHATGTLLTMVVVPEPSTALLLGLGVATFGIRRGRIRALSGSPWHRRDERTRDRMRGVHFELRRTGC